jgi:hypothetical protein
MPSLLETATPTPVDPHERREEWRFALLLLAMFAAEAAEQQDRPRRRLASGALTKVGDVRRTGRLVRPPRSC